jgi:PAS domain S-box-containing protein
MAAFDGAAGSKRTRNGRIGARGDLRGLMKRESAAFTNPEELLCEQTSLLELAHDAIIVRDLEARITYWNKAAEKLYGWRRGEAEGRVVHKLLATRFPIPLSEIESIVLDKGEWQGEIVHVTRQNTQVTVESRWAVQRDKDSNPLAILEINRDITARKIAESAAKAYESKLEKSNRELQDFAFMASHDLQEPLRKLSAFSSILTARFADALGKEGQAYLNKMLESTVRMQSLIESLLMYSRVATGSQPFGEVDLRGLIGEAIRDLEVPIEETGARVEIGHLPEIQADPGQIRQLFQNLIGNALKFHGENPLIRIYGEVRPEGVCTIFIEDNGIGFDEKHLERIFQPFQRLHGRSSSYKGSGMGLAICRKIVDRHSGSISARSVPGKGSTFIVTMPLKQSDEIESYAA